MEFSFINPEEVGKLPISASPPSTTTGNADEEVTMLSRQLAASVSRYFQQVHVCQQALFGQSFSGIHEGNARNKEEDPKGSPEQSTLLDAMMEILNEEQAQGTLTGWRNALPKCIMLSSGKVALRIEEEIEYLCALIAIDFRHWDAAATDEINPKEEKKEVSNTNDGKNGDDENSGERDGIVIKQWYCIDEDEEESTTTALPSSKKVLIRGSAAMVYLLKKAVEKDGKKWFDWEFLSQESENHLTLFFQKIFTGVEADGETSMVIPALKERVAILREIALKFASSHHPGHLSCDKLMKSEDGENVNVGNQKQQSAVFPFASYTEMIIACDGYLFSHEKKSKNEAKGGNEGKVEDRKAPGLLDLLIALSSRYNDTSTLTDSESQNPCTVQIHLFKLAQLTVIALSSAFHALNQGEWVSKLQDSVPLKNSWFGSYSASSSSCASLQLKFFDSHLLSIAPDYQVPRALRHFGIIVYSSKLAQKIDGRQLLKPGSREEVEIRALSSLCGHVLVTLLKRKMSEKEKKVRHENGEAQKRETKDEEGEGEKGDLHPSSQQIDIGIVDYLLWFIGRNVDRSIPHHLCMTVMY